MINIKYSIQIKEWERWRSEDQKVRPLSVTKEPAWAATKASHLTIKLTNYLNRHLKIKMT